MTKKIFFVLLISAIVTFGEGREAKITTKSGKEITAFIVRVYEVGLIDKYDNIYLYKAISRVQTNSLEIVEKIMEYTEGSSYEKMNFDYYVKVGNQSWKPEEKKFSGEILTFRSFDYTVSTDMMLLTDFSLSFTSPYTPRLIIKHGWSVGSVVPDKHIYLVPAFHFGFGRYFDYGDFRINVVGQIIRSFHPEYSNFDDGTDGGILYGFDIYGQYLIGEKKHYMITLGLKHSFNSFASDSKQNIFNLYIGFGINYDR